MFPAIYDIINIIINLQIGSQDGVAYSLITKKESNFAGHLVNCLEGANQAVPQALMELAMQVGCCCCC